MNSPNTPANRSISIVWVVPIIALIASGFLIFRQFRSSGPVIEIDFVSGSGIEAGKTPLVFKGVVVGMVQEIALKPDLNGVTVKVELEASAKPLAVEGSQFWLVKPEIGFGGVRGLDTLLRGARLGVRPGRGETARQFTALQRAPANEGVVPGTNYVLRSDSLGSLHPGTGIYYREVKVGAVEDSRLADESTHVLVTFRVYGPYDKLVKADTKFWNSGGISMKVGLLGARVETNSLESIVTGGVSFATPDAAADAAQAPEGTVFEIVDNHEKAWLKWAPKIPLGPVPEDIPAEQPAGT